MKTTNALLLIASIGLLAGCSTNQPAEPTATASTTTASPTSHKIGTVSSDVTGSMLRPRAALPVSRTVVHVSQALPPIDVLGAGQMAPSTDHLEVFSLVSKGTAGATSVPIDSTEGETYLFVTPQVEGKDAISAALRDVVVLDPNGTRVNVRDPKFEHGEEDLAAMTAIPLAGHPAGKYTVQFKSGAAKNGFALQANVPASKIKLTLHPTTVEHLLGNQSFVEATLTENGSPITGAHLTSRLVHGETLGDVAGITFTEVGNGLYRAPIHTVLGDSNDVGAYLTDVVAEGTSPSGAAFQRHGRTGFHYGIPTARITGIAGHRLVTNDKGEISGFDVDVNVDSRSLDRLEISAKLTVLGSDGQEHPIAIAHMGQAFDAGQQMVTLHFDAGAVRLTGAEGDFYVRDLQMFSLGTNTLFHREMAAQNRLFPGIMRASLMRLETLSPAQEQLVNEGTFRND